MRKIMVAAVLMLAGCAVTSQVEPMGDGKYSVTAGSHSLGSNGLGQTRTEALKSANEFCARQKKEIQIDSFDNQMTINTYSSSLVFRCK